MHHPNNAHMYKYIALSKPEGEVCLCEQEYVCTSRVVGTSRQPAHVWRGQHPTTHQSPASASLACLALETPPAEPVPRGARGVTGSSLQ